MYYAHNLTEQSPRATHGRIAPGKRKADSGVHADFGAGLWEGAPIGIPYTDVAGDQARVAVSFTYDDESDPGPYPIPTGAPIERTASATTAGASTLLRRTS